VRQRDERLVIRSTGADTRRPLKDSYDDYRWTTCSTSPWCLARALGSRPYRRSRPRRHSRPTRSAGWPS